MPDVKRAHMVSRGYLEQWSNARGLLLVHDKENSTTNPVRSLGDATVVRYAYRTQLTTIDLEREYSTIESRGIPALRTLGAGGLVTSVGEEAIISFLDMHRERGGFADKTKESLPLAAGDVFTGGMQMVNAGLGDRIALSRVIDQSRVRLTSLDLRHWRWHVFGVESGLITGDGAVLLWGRNGNINAISFPLSPTRLLIIGNGLEGATVPINDLVAANSKRWIVGKIA
jgi:hypothetical protein